MTSRDERSRVLDAAIAVLAAHGIEGLTVRAVAHEAGRSTRGIYYYFGSKQELLDAIHASGFELFRHYVGDLDGETPRAALRESMLKYRVWAVEHPTQYLLMFASKSAGYEAGDASWETADGSFADLRERVAAAVAGGELASRDDDLALHLWSAIHGYVMLELAGPLGPGHDAAAHYERGVDRLLGDRP